MLDPSSLGVLMMMRLFLLKQVYLLRVCTMQAMSTLFVMTRGIGEKPQECIYYDQLVSPLIKIVKDLKDRIEALEAE